MDRDGRDLRQSVGGISYVLMAAFRLGFHFITILTHLSAYFAPKYCIFFTNIEDIFPIFIKFTDLKKQ